MTAIVDVAIAYVVGKLPGTTDVPPRLAGMAAAAYDAGRPAAALGLHTGRMLRGAA
jgi:hypothetical protein